MLQEYWASKVIFIGIFSQCICLISTMLLRYPPRASYNNTDLEVSSDSALLDSWKSFHDAERFYAFLYCLLSIYKFSLRVFDCLVFFRTFSRNDGILRGMSRKSRSHQFNVASFSISF